MNVKIIDKVIALIKKQGIPEYIHAWNYNDNYKKLQEKWKTYNDEEKFYELSLFVKTYHNHTSLWNSKWNIENINTTSISSKKHINKFPETIYKNKILYLKYFTWLSDTQNNEKKYIDIINKAYNNMYKKGIDKIVIDLREHSGGNMWTGVKSLAQIIGPNRLLLSWTKEKKLNKKDMHLYLDNNCDDKITESVKIYNKLIKDNTLFNGKIEILIGDNTYSSGELIAACLEGFNNVIIKGTSGGGCSTNGMFKLNKDIELILTTHLARRKNGNIEEFIAPTLQMSFIDHKISLK